MRDTTIARNYAEALFELGERLGQTEQFAGLLSALAAVLETEPRVRIALESPRVPKRTKQRILEAALRGYAPESLRRFLAAVIKRGRQGLIPVIGSEFASLVDGKFNRVRVSVTLAREPDAALQEALRDRLGAALRKEVVPHFRTDPAILGGVILRVDGRLIDGSLRRRLVTLRRQLLGR